MDIGQAPFITLATALWKERRHPAFSAAAQAAHDLIEIVADVGLRHEELTRYLAFEQSLEDAAPVGRQEKRRAPTAYDWEEAQLEAFRLVYFDGVPPSFGALIRHIQGWYIAKGGRVPDESTLKRRLRKFWTIFGPEAQDKAA